MNKNIVFNPFTNGFDLKDFSFGKNSPHLTFEDFFPRKKNDNTIKENEDKNNRTLLEENINRKDLNLKENIFIGIKKKNNNNYNNVSTNKKNEDLTSFISFPFLLAGQSCSCLCGSR